MQGCTGENTPDPIGSSSFLAFVGSGAVLCGTIRRRQRSLALSPVGRNQPQMFTHLFCRKGPAGEERGRWLLIIFVASSGEQLVCSGLVGSKNNVLV